MSRSILEFKGSIYVLDHYMDLSGFYKKTKYIEQNLLDIYQNKYIVYTNKSNGMGYILEFNKVEKIEDKGTGEIEDLKIELNINVELDIPYFKL